MMSFHRGASELRPGSWPAIESEACKFARGCGFVRASLWFRARVREPSREAGAPLEKVCKKPVSGNQAED